MRIRKAEIADVKAVHKLVNDFAKKQQMLPRSLNELYENIRDLLICEHDGALVGVCALHILWDDLAEIKSLAVSSDYHGKGIGAKLVRRALKDASGLGIKKVFALTYNPEFFARLGFREVDKGTLPQKIWTDCIKCPSFPECGERAVIIELE